MSFTALDAHSLNRPANAAAVAASPTARQSGIVIDSASR